MTLAALALPCATAFAQDIVRLTGKVTLKGDGEPLIGVNITDASSRRAVGTTDLDGRFAFNVRHHAEIQHGGHEVTHSEGERPEICGAGA